MDLRSYLMQANLKAPHGGGNDPFEEPILVYQEQVNDFDVLRELYLRLFEKFEDDAQGRFDGYEHGDDDAQLFFYSADPHNFFARVEPMLRGCSELKGAQVRIGGRISGSKVREFTL